MPALQRPKRRHSVRSSSIRFDLGGIAQHSLVEHALCSVDRKTSLVDGYLHETGYFFQDKNRNLKKANVRVACPFGLSPNDELFLWGLLHLVFAQNDPTPEFSATPHFCLRQLGIVDAKSNQGKRYDVFRQAIHRLAGVVYSNDGFYDPIRGEHRNVAFGLLKYSLPLDPSSSRAWRFIWDQQFFEFCYAMRGAFQFDLSTYRELDFASRRLFLFLAKQFWRRPRVTADLTHLAVNVLGFSPKVAIPDLKIKLRRCAEKLVGAGVIELPATHPALADLFAKRARGRYDVTFHRGPYFDRPYGGPSTLKLCDSHIYDPLKSIGFDDTSIHHILRTYKPRMIQEWADITLAAVEREIINKDPKAYFHYYIQRAAKRETTPPDWWYELRKKEQKRDVERQLAGSPTVSDAFCRSDGFDRAFDAYIACEAKDAFHSIMSDLTTQFSKAGQSDPQARQSAEQFARQHLRNRFVADHPEFRESE